MGMKSLKQAVTSEGIFMVSYQRFLLFVTDFGLGNIMFRSYLFRLEFIVCHWFDLADTMFHGYLFRLEFMV